MTAMRNFLFQCQLHKLFRRRAHVLKALSERHHRKAHAFQILHHLHRSPPVKSDLPDIEPLFQALNELFNVAVMHHIPLGCLDKALPLPQVIGHMVTLHP